MSFEELIQKLIPPLVFEYFVEGASLRSVHRIPISFEIMARQYGFEAYTMINPDNPFCYFNVILIDSKLIKIEYLAYRKYEWFDDKTWPDNVRPSRVCPPGYSRYDVEADPFKAIKITDYKGELSDVIKERFDDPKAFSDDWIELTKNVFLRRRFDDEKKFRYNGKMP